MVNTLDAQDTKVDLPKVASDSCAHLNSDQQEDLLALLGKYNTLFDCTLGDWKTEHAGLEIKKGVNPFHDRPFPVPVMHRDTLKKEVNRLVELGVLKWQGDSEWASPNFIIPKKN